MYVRNQCFVVCPSRYTGNYGKLFNSLNIWLTHCSASDRHDGIQVVCRGGVHSLRDYLCTYFHERDVGFEPSTIYGRLRSAHPHLSQVASRACPEYTSSTQPTPLKLDGPGTIEMLQDVQSS